MEDNGKYGIYAVYNSLFINKTQKIHSRCIPLNIPDGSFSDHKLARK
jgi:hypothetical protein